tara:strand:+ start:601 stop:1233 length:633 start_codon:yes stop_codon:yes gene_type:complete
MTAPSLSRTLILVLFFCNSTVSISQVGINTTDPRTTLEVAGSTIISGNLEIGVLNPILDSDTNTFLIQDTDDTIKSLDVSNPTAAALGYIQDYIITNPFQDYVKDFDTGIDANDFVMVALTSHFNDDLKLSNNNNLSDNFSLPTTATFISGGTWHITANYPVAGNPGSSVVGSWFITTLIFSKDLSRQLGTENIPMSSTTSGSAITPIID